MTPPTSNATPAIPDDEQEMYKRIRQINANGMRETALYILRLESTIAQAESERDQLREALAVKLSKLKLQDLPTLALEVVAKMSAAELDRRAALAAAEGKK